MAGRMASLPQDANVRWRLLAASVTLLLTQVLANAFPVISAQDNSAAEQGVVVEVIITCVPNCGTGTKERALRLRLFEDATAEYLTSKSDAHDPIESDILLKRRARLSKDEYDQFISLAESSRFLNAAQWYGSRSLIDLTIYTEITYRKIGTIKKIHLNNYIPGNESVGLPNEVRQLVNRTWKLCEKIAKSGR